MNLSLALDYFHLNRDRTLRRLRELVQIPSISFPHFPLEAIEECARATMQLCLDIGLQNVQILRVPGANPAVYGDWIVDPQAPTFLLYAHYDVQPVGREDLWQSAPFDPQIREGRLYARGTADDKSGILVHLASLEAYLRTEQQLPINIRVLFEGEEEVGSPHMEEFLCQYPELFQCQAVVIADLSNFDTGIPSLTTSLRGHVTLEIELKSMAGPLHSGLWSGALPDPVAHLCRILGSLTDQNGIPTLPQLLQGIHIPNTSEQQDWSQLPLDVTNFRQQASLLPQIPLPSNSWEILAQNWRYPTLTITCLQGGQRSQTGNVILEKAWARLGLRIAPGQNATEMGQILQAHLQSLCPTGMEMQIDMDHPAQAWSSPTQHPYQQFALQAMTQSWNCPAYTIGCGATIPLVQLFENKLGQPVMLLTGVEDPACRAHAENESLHLDDFFKAIESQIRFFALMAQ